MILYKAHHNDSILTNVRIYLLQHELTRAYVFLETMGYKARTEVRNVDISLSYQEAKEYGKIFRQFDKDNDGHISLHDLRKALQVHVLYMHVYMYYISQTNVSCISCGDVDWM